MGVLHYDFKGMLYDEWELDKVYTTGARTIRESDVTSYCALSGDYDPHYTNEPFAEQDYYKKPVVPGGLTSSSPTDWTARPSGWTAAISGCWISRCPS